MTEIDGHEEPEYAGSESFANTSRNVNVRASNDFHADSEVDDENLESDNEESHVGESREDNECSIEDLSLNGHIRK